MLQAAFDRVFAVLVATGLTVTWLDNPDTLRHRDTEKEITSSGRRTSCPSSPRVRVAVDVDRDFGPGQEADERPGLQRRVSFTPTFIWPRCQTPGLSASPALPLVPR